MTPLTGYGAKIEIANIKQVEQLGSAPYQPFYLYSGEMGNLTLIYQHYIYPNTPIVFDEMLKEYPTATAFYVAGSADSLYEVTMK